MRKATARAIKQPVPEAGVLRACLDLLGYSKIWHERRNTVPVLVDDGRGGKRPIKVAEPGTADIMATPRRKTEIGQNVRPDVWILWIECKSDSGRQTPEQVVFEREVSEAGHHYLVVRDVDTLKQWLIEHGVIRG